MKIRNMLLKCSLYLGLALSFSGTLNAAVAIVISHGLDLHPEYAAEYLNGAIYALSLSGAIFLAGGVILLCFSYYFGDSVICALNTLALSCIMCGLWKGDFNAAIVGVCALILLSLFNLSDKLVKCIPIFNYWCFGISASVLFTMAYFDIHASFNMLMVLVMAFIFTLILIWYARVTSWCRKCTVRKKADVISSVDEYGKEQYLLTFTGTDDEKHEFHITEIPRHTVYSRVTIHINPDNVNEFYIGRMPGFGWIVLSIFVIAFSLYSPIIPL